MCFVIFVSHQTAAATQGQWGRTSTATAKITLIIPPKNTAHNVQPNNGFEALNAICRQQSDFGNTSLQTSLYQVTLPGHSSAGLQAVLARRCAGDNKPLSAIKMPNQSETVTLLVSPL